ncbi:MAG TPA: hypothetical protein VK607_06950, partial [Kofleriaceae bacterium]|nr:hypothetical protein [Kofleriaceae bacterium]
MTPAIAYPPARPGGVLEPRPARSHRELALRSDEVARQAVRLVVVNAEPPRLEAFAALPRLLRRGDLV